MKRLQFILVSIVVLSGCSVDPELPHPAIPDYVFQGGSTTIFDATSNAFATPAPNLSNENFDRHLEGDLTFEQTFVTAPAVVNPGLGPLFNNNSCVSCHVRNGRGEPSLNGDDLSGFLLRLSIPGIDDFGGPKPVPNFGTQLQNRAVFGKEAEATFTATEIEALVTFLDGTTANITQPVYELSDPYNSIPDDIMISPRVAPAVFGLGLLEAIPDSRLLSLADVNDVDGDGISGKPNRVWNFQEEEYTLGRFGWKAESPTTVQQTAEAYHQDMGITNPIFSEENCVDQYNCEDDGQIDIGLATVDVTAFYFQTLAVPAMRNYDQPEVQEGRALFEKINCSSCHVPGHTTGVSPLEELSNQKIFPYTDLLLHDMGPGLADNRPSYEANGQEWRTPPLWGLGMLPVVNGHTRLLHDGRARSIEEAILWHGGEAEQSKQAYTELSIEERKNLLQFLNAL